MALSGYHMIGQIGIGSYSVVYKARTSIPHRKYVAIKCISKNKLSKTSQDNVIREIAIMKKLKNKCILNLIDFTWDSSHIYLITEYCDKGDLAQFLKSHGGCLSELLLHRFMQHLSYGLKFLRSHNISHFDLKPQNLLLIQQVRLNLKIADFGFAQHISEKTQVKNIKGSFGYMAPEMLISQSYNAKADLWSVGIILYECVYRRLPLPSKLSDLIYSMRNHTPILFPVSSVVDKECSDLLSRLLKYDPDERINFVDFYSHPFIDLEHMACEDSLQKGLLLINRATDLDSQQKFAEALNLYCEGLCYLVPYLYELDASEAKSNLRQMVLRSTTRAELLKSTYGRK